VLKVSAQPVQSLQSYHVLVNPQTVSCHCQTVYLNRTENLIVICWRIGGDLSMQTDNHYLSSNLGILNELCWICVGV